MRTVKIWILALTAALLLCGCSMHTTDDMYAIPKRSEDYNNLQTSIDKAMTGLVYSAPVVGENRQSVQMADLDGDGTDEYLVFAKDNKDHPLKILVFLNMGGAYDHVATLENNGTAFDQIEYIQLDDKPGVEILVGRQLSDQVFRSVSVYAMKNSEVEQIAVLDYTKILPVDMNNDSISEVLLIKPGEVDGNKGSVALYAVKDGAFTRSNEADMSQPVDKIKRIITGKLEGGGNAVYIASTVDETTLVTDVFVLREGLLSNMTLSVESGTSVKTMRNYYIYADDIDNDGVVELPALINMKAINFLTANDQLHLIRWYALTASGEEVDKMYTFHNFRDGWYLQWEKTLAERIAVSQRGTEYRFFVWDEEYRTTEILMDITTHVGQTRPEGTDSFLISRTDTAAYTAKLTPVAEKYGITQDSLIYNFRLIHEDWKTGET